jgi:uncharacterized protein YkwD
MGGRFGKACAVLAACWAVAGGQASAADVGGKRGSFALPGEKSCLCKPKKEETPPPAPVADAPAPDADGRMKTAQLGIDIINRLREANGVVAVVVDGKLVALAWDHSQKMEETGVFEHEIDGVSWAGKALEAGFSGAGENIAVADSVAEAIASWEGSPEHRNEMLHPDRTAMGIAGVGKYWTLVTGSK